MVIGRRCGVGQRLVWVCVVAVQTSDDVHVPILVRIDEELKGSLIRVAGFAWEGV